tara:strand:- start:11587 stop:11757 length:171 start_codon:yes stop_codon:yes gene_type:complete
MIPGLIIKQVLKLALKGAISEKVIKALVIKLVEVLVKSTKNDLDDKAWKEIKKILK